MFTIDAVRFGHACNSSSTHSFIIPETEVTTDEFSDFGWDYFTVASGDIDRYLAATISSCISYGTPDATKRAILNKVNELLELSLSEDGFESTYVDHQSLLRMPGQFGNPNVPDWDYVNDLRRWFKTHNVAVLGGNDNDDSSHVLSGHGKFVGVPALEDYSPVVARYSGNQWVLFNPETGYRVRIRFDDKQPTRPNAPELVDLKITDYCESNCGYCYQGSTKNGQHASYQSIANVLYELASMKVFEVAFGGGEPTTHPDFKRIVELTKAVGIVPNVTTRNYNFVRDNYTWCAEHLGTIAVSVDSATQVHRVRALHTLSDGKIRFNVQVVAGGAYGFDEVLKAAGEHLPGLCRGIPVTLLGFKEQERGKNFEQRRSYKNWKELVKEHHPRGFNVDTAFLQLHRAELDEIAGARASKFYTLNEGIYSCYIDAVKMEIAPSSYCDKSDYIPLYSMSPQEMINEFDSTLTIRQSRLSIRDRWLQLPYEPLDTKVHKGHGFEMASHGTKWEYDF